MLQPETAGSTSLAEQLSTAKTPLSSFLSQFLSKFASAAEPKAPVSQVAARPVRRFPKPSGFNKYTYAEVAKHNTPDDAWLIVDNQVYDVSGMKHPGGDVVFSYAGRDATELFHVMHKNQALVRTVMKAHLIGEVAAPAKTELLNDFNAMLAEFERDGFMNANPLYYTRKLLELVGLVAASIWISTAMPNVLGAVLASLCMATFFYQNGWTQHDFQHNQVFRSHKLNALVGGWIIALGMGGSAHWWKTKHNQHHATPNKMDGQDKHAVDPDIDTVPLIAWSEELAKQVPPGDRGIISLQHILVWPMLFIALVNWQAQSVIHLLSYPNVPAKAKRYELGLIIAHHTWVAVASFWPLGWKLGALHWALSHMLGGFVTAFVFIQSHNAMEIYTDDYDFVTSQMVSTRNINPGVVADWVCGGLNYQIEHHLFPTMPRHSFSRVRRQVMEFCSKHGLPYESVSIWESTSKVYQALKDVAKTA